MLFDKRHYITQIIIILLYTYSFLVLERKINMSKYEPLWKYVKENNKDEYKLSFEEVKKIVGFDFDHAFLTYKKELLDYGYEFKKLSLKEKWVMIVKK